MFRRPLLVFPLALLVLGACGSSPPSTARPGAVPGDAGDIAARDPVPRPLRDDRPIAEHRGTVDGSTVTVSLLPLRRRGQTISLQLSLSTRAGETMRLGDELDDGAKQRSRRPGSVFPYEGYGLDGIALVDGLHRRLYRPARDRYGACVCDETENVELVPGVPLRLSATFGAPPPDVHAVDVVVPRFGTFGDVPLG